MMKKLVLSVLAVTVFLGLSGCGSDNYVALYPTKATITFAVMSSSKAGDVAITSSTTGLQYAYLLATVPSYAHISSTTGPGPALSGVVGLNSNLQFPVSLAGTKRISASALKAAGVFASNSSVAKRTKITGFFMDDKFQKGKDVAIYMVYSSPQTPGAVKVTGSSIDFADLTISFPAGQLLSGDFIKDINAAFWEPNWANGYSQFGLFPPGGFFIGFLNSANQLTKTLPTISKILLGY